MINLEPGAALFQGQGAQVPGSYFGLYETNKTFRARIDRADQLCRPYGFTVSDLWYGVRKSELVGDAADTSKIQPSLTAIECGVYGVLQSHGVEAHRMHLGHSLGQIPAAVASNGLSFDKAIKLAIFRGEVMEEFRKVRETAVGLIRDVQGQYVDLSGQVQTYLEEIRPEIPDTYVTVLNHQYQLLIGGPLAEVGKVLQDLKGKLPGIKVTSYKNAPLSHTPYMQSGQDAYNAKMDDVLKEDEDSKGEKFSEKLKIPIVSDVLGHVMEGANEFFGSARLQLIRQVDWRANLEFMSQANIKEALEIGPKRMFADMVATINPEIQVFPTDNEAAIEVVLGRYGKRRKGFASLASP